MTIHSETAAPIPQLTPIDYSRKWYVMTAVGIATSLETIDTSIVNLALPTLVRTFATDFATVQWVILAFVLTQATLMLVIGRLGDMVGKKPIFLAGFVVTAIGTILCGLAPSIGWLIAARVVQAIGVALALALSLAVATEAFPPNERGKALGIVGATVSIGIVIGPILGGFLLDRFSWRWIFLATVPMSLIGFPVAWRYLPDVRPSGRQQFDFAGALTFFVALLCFLLATTYGRSLGYRAPWILALFGGAALFGLLFLAIELRSKQPVVDPRLFQQRLFSLNLFLRLMSFVIFVGVTLLLPFYLENVLGYNPQQSGLLLITVPIAFGALAPLAGTLGDRFGNRPVALVGLLLMLLGCITATTLSEQTGASGFIWRLLPLGAGMGIFQSPNNSVIFSVVPKERMGMASSLMSVIRTLGRSTGIALVGAIWASRTLFYSGVGYTGSLTNAPVSAQLRGLQEGFWVLAAFVLLLIGLSLWDWWRERLPAGA